MSDQLERLNELGPQIEARHIALGMSQAEFTRAVGMSDTQLRPILKGTATQLPRPATLVKISRALGLPPDTLRAAIVENEPLPDPPPASPAALPIPDLEMAARIGQLNPEDRAEMEALLREKLGLE